MICIYGRNKVKQLIKNVIQGLERWLSNCERARAACRGPTSFSAPHGGSQLPATMVPGDPSLF